MFTTVLIAALVFALVTGSLLGTTLAAAGLLVLEYKFGGNFSVIANGIWNIFNSFTLTAVPMFILLGELLGETGIAKRIYGALSPLFERLPGGLLQTNIGICTAFAAISGSSTATAAVVGSIAYRELTGRGYDRKAVTGGIAAGGTLGILIPPSIPLIIYGSMMEVSIGSLFVAGVVPGLALSVLFMIFIAFQATRRPGLAPRGPSVPLARALRHSAAAWPFLIIVFAILGTLFLGLATPTESASLGVFTVIALAFFYREMTFKRFWTALRSTTLIYGSLAIIIVGAVVLSQAVALTGLPRTLLSMLERGGFQSWQVVGLIYLLYLVLGCFFGPLEMMLITLPFTFPLMVGLGYDPVWFGIALVILIEVGLLTPPVGINLYVVTALSKGEVNLGQAAAACVPYWVIMLAFLLLLTLYPQIVLFLPRLII